MNEVSENWDKVRTIGQQVEGMSKENLKKILNRKRLPPKWNFKFKKAASSINVQISDEQLESIN